LEELIEAQKQEIAELKEKLTSNYIPRSASALLEDKTRDRTPAEEITVKKTNSKTSPDKKAKPNTTNNRTKPESKKLSPTGRKPSPLNKKANLIERMTPLGTSNKVEYDKSPEEKREVSEDIIQRTEQPELIEESKVASETYEFIATESIVSNEQTQELAGGRAKARAKAITAMNRSKGESRSPEQANAIPKPTENEAESFNLSQENLEADVQEEEVSDNKSKEVAVKKGKDNDSKLYGYMAPVKFKTFEKLTRTQKVGAAIIKSDPHRKPNPSKPSTNNKSGVSNKQKKSPNTVAKKSSELTTSSTVPRLRSVSASGYARRP